METTTQSAESQPVREGFSLWPKQLLGPPPGLKELNLACWGLFLGLVVIPICVISWIHAKRGMGSIRQLHSDFVYFYGDGMIAREYPAVRLYDYALQDRVFNAIYPAHAGYYGPSPYPPFVALFFRPFARLSFETAYLVWMATSLLLYIVGVMASCKATFSKERLKISLLMCFALAFSPFFFSTLINGQLSAVAVCAVGLAIYQEKQGNPVRSGLALALLAYKPTLLLLIIPMLLLTRRFRALLGFIAGAVALALVATAADGLAIWPAYARMLRGFGRASGIGAATHLRLWQYLDLHSSFAAVPAGTSPTGLIVLACAISAGTIALAFLLWKSANRGHETQWLAWAATLTWTMLLNVYVPIYDSVLVVIAVILTLGALRDLKWGKGAEWTILLALAIFAVSWKTEAFAQAHKIQLLTLALLILGTVQLVFLRRATRRELAA